jgi:hypothetical protein
MTLFGGLPVALCRHCVQSTSVAGHFLGQNRKMVGLSKRETKALVPNSVGDRNS